MKLLQRNSNLYQLLIWQKFFPTCSCCRLRIKSDSPLPTKYGTLFSLNPTKRIVRGCVLLTHPKHIVWKFILHYILLFPMPPHFTKNSPIQKLPFIFYTAYVLKVMCTVYCTLAGCQSGYRVRYPPYQSVRMSLELAMCIIRNAVKVLKN